MSTVWNPTRNKCIDVTPGARDGEVWIDVTVEGGRYMTSLILPTPDFLAAVASELNVRIVPADAIMIERSELPAVTVVGDEAHVGELSFILAYHPADRRRSDAIAELALAEYLDANPPIDEAQVSALAEAIKVDGQTAGDYDELARRLYARGARVVTS